MNNNQNQEPSLEETWKATVLPRHEANQKVFERFLQTPDHNGHVLNCAVPRERARSLTNVEMPQGWEIKKCFPASIGRGFGIDGLRNWKYNPKICYREQLPYLHKLPVEHADLAKSPWFQSATPARGMAINARLLRYNHDLWHAIKPRVLQGVHTTIVFVTPQVGPSLTPHVTLDKAFNYLSALARSHGPAQLFPAEYLYPDARLSGMAHLPAPIFADILPLTGGVNFPMLDEFTKPNGSMIRFETSDNYWGYPFKRLKTPMDEAMLYDAVSGAMTLPDGRTVHARESQNYVYATLDAKLKDELACDRETFAFRHCLARGTVTHDGLPFQLPIEMQSMVFALVLTHWRMELARPGDLTRYTLKTRHAAIRGFNYYQRVEPYHSNFMRLVRWIARDPKFQAYPLATHLTCNWLGGNLRISNQLSESEQALGPVFMRSYYLQQLDWMMGVLNLWNDIAFRKGSDLEGALSMDGLALHQMRPQLQFDSHLFQRPTRPASVWPDLHPGWTELDTTGRIVSQLNPF